MPVTKTKADLILLNDKTGFWLRALGLLLLVFGCSLRGYSQNIRLELGKPEVALNEGFTITIVIEEGTVSNFSKFPEIEGFEKAGRSSSTTTSIVNGKTSHSQRLTQNYKPQAEGTFRLRPFSMRINEESVDSKGMTIKVKPPAEPTAPAAADQDIFPADPFAGPPGAEEDYLDKKESAFLSLHTSKDAVFAGEGVHVSLYFYLAFEDRYLLEFYNFASQLPELVKQVRQPNVWEEFFEQYDIEPEHLEIDGKPFLRFKLYEAVYFPLNTDPLLFPAIGLKMIKYKMLKNPRLFGATRKEELKTYYSSPKIVEVKPLPPHPLKDQVAVGNYQLREGLEHKKLRTGRGTHYWFEVAGEGNIAAIGAPASTPLPGLETQPPTVRQVVNRAGGRVTGNKSFDYFLTPREPGTFELSRQFEFIFFNPATARYDTLRPAATLLATGPSHQNEIIQSADLGAFYEHLDRADNDLVSLQEFDQIRRYANLALLIMLLAAVGIFFFRR